jgi:hypothetical protein
MVVLTDVHRPLRGSVVEDAKVNEKELVDEFMKGNISAREMAAGIARLRRAKPTAAGESEARIPASLVRAQAAIRRINRGQ